MYQYYPRIGLDVWQVIVSIILFIIYVFRTQLIKIGTIKMIRLINANVKLKISLLFRNLNGKHFFRTSQHRADQTNTENIHSVIT